MMPRMMPLLVRLSEPACKPMLVSLLEVSLFKDR